MVQDCSVNQIRKEIPFERKKLSIISHLLPFFQQGSHCIPHTYTFVSVIKGISQWILQRVKLISEYWLCLTLQADEGKCKLIKLVFTLHAKRQFVSGVSGERRELLMTYLYICMLCLFSFGLRAESCDILLFHDKNLFWFIAPYFSGLNSHWHT